MQFASRGCTTYKTALVVALLLTLLVETSEAQDAAQPVLPADAIKDDATRAEPLLDNLSFLLALDASREPQDLGINANFGGFAAANLGFPVLEQFGLGGQVGAGVNLARAGVKVLSKVEGTRARQQEFTTAGLFQRGEGWHWGIVYDLQVESYYDSFVTGQFRGEAGLDLTPNDDVGFWGTAGGFGDNGDVTNVSVRLDPIASVSAYWRHRWPSLAETRFWLGVAESHGTDILLIPDRHSSGAVLSFGMEVFVPLSDHFVLFGQGNFITPSDTGTLDAYLGIAWYPGGGVYRVRTNAFAPVLAVANNPTFSLDLHRN